MKGCAELKVSDWQMIAWTSWFCDTVKGRRGMADDDHFMLKIHCWMYQWKNLKIGHYLMELRQKTWRVTFSSTLYIHSMARDRNTRDTAAGNRGRREGFGSPLPRNQHRRTANRWRATPHRDHRGASSDLSHRSARCARPALPTATGAARWCRDHTPSRGYTCTDDDIAPTIRRQLFALSAASHCKQEDTESSSENHVRPISQLRFDYDTTTIRLRRIRSPTITKREIWGCSPWTISPMLRLPGAKTLS